MQKLVKPVPSQLLALRASNSREAAAEGDLMFQIEVFYTSDFLQATVDDFWDMVKSYSYLPNSVIIFNLSIQHIFFPTLEKCIIVGRMPTTTRYFKISC